MTNSSGSRARSADKRQRLTAAAADVLHRQGVERTTIADIARSADVPVGNVYYYFKTKDDLVRAALGEQSRHLADLTQALEELADPRERLKALVAVWVEQREIAAQYGCPTGTLAVELDKCSEAGLDTEAGNLLLALLHWVESQFQQMGQPEPGGLAIALVGAYQGMSLLANALRDPQIMTREGDRLIQWLDSLTALKPA